MSLTSRILGIKPAWSDDPAPEVVIRPSGSVSSRRAYPAARNDRFVPAPVISPEIGLENLGEGNDIYFEPEEGEREDDRGIKRLRNVGAGAEVLVDQVEGDVENKLRSHTPKPGHLVSTDQFGDEIQHGTTGVTSGAEINIDGRIDTVNGVVSLLTEGRRGGTGAIAFTRCGGSEFGRVEWENGHITTNGVLIVDVGDCDGTETPGP